MPDHGIESTDPKVPQPLIDQAVDTVRALAGWHVFPVRVEHVVELCPGDGVVILPTKNLLGIDEFYIDGVAQQVDRLVWDASGVVHVPGLTPRRDGLSYKITAIIRHGYDAPADLIGVVKSIAARSAAPQGALQVGRINVGAPGAATPQSTEWRILDLYKLGARP